MLKKQFSVLCAATLVVVAATGCGPNPNQGFTMSTQERIASPVAGGLPGPAFPLVETPVEGHWTASDGTNNGGTVSSYDSDTNTLGLYYVSDGIAPAYWTHDVFMPSFCPYPVTPGVIYVGSTFGGLNQFEVQEVLTANLGTYEWDCISSPASIPDASSRFAIAGHIPSSVTVSALNPFTTTNGLPVMYVFDGISGNGSPNLLTTITATSVVSGGSAATFPLPSSLAQNAYAFETANKTSSGTTPNSFNLYAVAGTQTIAGNPFGVAVGGVTDAWEDRDSCDRGESSGSTYDTFQVISLYSLNQVQIGGLAVNVGANPTAVTAYNGPRVSRSSSDSCDSYRDVYSGTTRALVANSGANTVTILDLVNDVSLGNVTVGNQPVALAVTSDGGTAYVANYTDSSVTRIALSSGNTTTTVAVGGHPTSLALTAGGVLWVGGSGFLTEINTSTMTATATESTGSKSIVALGYSDGVGQIVATTVDGSGNVYADQLKPSSVTAGGTYTPSKSNLVSSLGTHLNTRTNTNVRSFTATLASSAVLNINEPGAPPLVVQDGWAVVTATPGGFTITDIADNVVIDSETTSSPVTSIAVDPSLNVVYLTMPDSNTVMTVPLPGTSTTTNTIL